jgi:hypothetical protein
MKYVGHLPLPLRRIETKLDSLRLPFNWREALICWPIALTGLIIIIVKHFEKAGF